MFDIIFVTKINYKITDNLLRKNILYDILVIMEEL